MSKTNFFLNISCTIACLILFSEASIAQSNSLQIFESLTGKNWKGHYVDSEDSIYTHYIKWEYILDNKTVRETKTVSELNFEMVTYYYFDWEKDQISYLSLLNKDMMSTGTVHIKSSKIVLTGSTYFDGGAYNFKKTFELDDNGNLIDKFFRKKGDTWVKGHIIKFE